MAALDEAGLLQERTLQAMLPGGRQMELTGFLCVDEARLNALEPAKAGELHASGALALAYLHLLHVGNDALLGDIRQLWKQVLIVNRPGRPREQIGADVEAGLADIEAYGQGVLANPDFLHRLEKDAPLNVGDRNTFFAGGAGGYTDYPTL